MVPLVQLVRASDCGSECHGFESHRAPKKRLTSKVSLFFCIMDRRITGITVWDQCKIRVVLSFCITGCSQCWLFLFPARKSVLNLADTWKRHPGQKIGLIYGHHRHKASCASPSGVARAACFEELAGVFASSGALHYAKIFASLKIKNVISLTPLNCALNAFAFTLNDSAED